MLHPTNSALKKLNKERHLLGDSQSIKNLTVCNVPTELFVLSLNKLNSMLRAVESLSQVLEKEVVMVFALLHLHQVCYGTVVTSFRVENVDVYYN